MPSPISKHALANISKALASGWKKTMYLGPFSYLREYKKHKRMKIA